jgi:solute carrier family 35 (UDP-sugar transporter), member A1/2/3
MTDTITGFLHGYDEYVWSVIILQAAGGLIVAVVVKYADNVLKGFATSLSILISAFVSSYLFGDVDINKAFLFGCIVVLASVFAFGYNPASITKVTKVLST